MMVGERNIVHRDMNAHLWRWSFVLNRARMGQSWIDFGCGEGGLIETLYRNQYRPSYFIGLDIRPHVISRNQKRYGALKFPVKFIEADLVHQPFDERFLNDVDYPNFVTCFEVIEHVGKHRGRSFLENMRLCGNEDTVFYLSTPNFDPKVGAAGNHTYDAQDGNGVQPQEWDHDELNELIESAGFEIVEEFGTFASYRDYKESLSPCDRELYTRLKRYYDPNLVSNIMAPLVDPRLCRNALRVMRLA